MKRRPLVLALLGAMFIFMGYTAVRRVYTNSTDFDGLWRAGRAVIEGTPVYHLDGAVNRYLPFFAVFMVPLALLPMAVAVAIWHVLSCAALLLSVRWSFDLLGKPRAIDDAPFLAVLLMTGVFWVASMTMGQIGLVTLALSIGAVRFARDGRPWLGGALAGLAAAIKVTPAVIGVYFLLKRRWTAAAASFLGFAACCAIPAAVWGPRKTVDMHRQWQEEGAATAGVQYFEDRESMRYQNQSLHAFMARLLMDVNAGRSKKPFQVNVASLSPAAVHRATLFIQIPIALAALLVMFARRREERLLLAEVAVVLAATTFGSPIAWTFHMVVLIPAFAVLWEHRAEREARFWMIAALVLEAGIAFPVTRALGFLTWSCLAAGIGAWRIAWRERQTATNLG